MSQPKKATSSDDPRRSIPSEKDVERLFVRNQYKHLTYYYRKDEDGNTKIELNCTLLKFTENNISQHV